jgi:hypothetical protein
LAVVEAEGQNQHNSNPVSVCPRSLQPIQQVAPPRRPLFRRSGAAYYPKTNVLVPIRSIAAKTIQPASKCVRITLTPVAPAQALHFSQAVIDHNVDRAVPRIP